jgi:uncharacterized metal-binding protein
MKCALCNDKGCYDHQKSCSSTKKMALKEYTSENKKVLSIASQLEKEHYMQLTRVEEVIQYALIMGYKKIGIAFCMGLEKEANILHTIFEKHFEVYSVCCKNGSIDKSIFDLPKFDETKHEAMCNPVGQAMELNQCETELNLIVGLCIGHDILFTQYAKAPVTTLIVKDRVLSHNPAGALYSDYYLVEEKK